MSHRLNRRVLAFVLLALFLTDIGWSQHTFRGGINGIVTDQSGALIAGAKVEIKNEATNVTATTISSSAGEYAFPELSLGKYDVVVNASGFKTEKITGVLVSAGVIFTQPVKLATVSTITTSGTIFPLSTRAAFPELQVSSCRSMRWSSSRFRQMLRRMQAVTRAAPPLSV
jgi:hypothetical protein